MSRPRFFADQNLNADIIDGLHRVEPAIEFVVAHEVGMAERPDDQVLEFAANDGLIVVSHDVKTMRRFAYDRLQAGRKMAGLLLIRQRVSVARAIDELLLVWTASEAEEWAGVVRFLPLS
jgi:predicted nuclease of predicted toxin-antitoxin system